VLIAHLTTVHDPFDTRILRRECVSLVSEMGLSVQLLNAKGIDGDFEGVVLRSFDTAGPRVKRITITMIRAYRAALKANADLYHIHDPELLLVAWMLKRKQCRIIFDCHENFIEKATGRDWIPYALRKTVSAFYGAVARRILPRLDHVISATSDIATKLPTANCTVVRNLPSIFLIDRGRTSCPRQADLILYTGGLTANRGIEQVVRGLVEHCTVPWRLVVVGRENRAVSTRIAEYLGDDRIDYRGPVSFEEVVHLMASAAIGVVCNQSRFDYQNALPNKLFEYLAAALPVVCSAFPKWIELVEETGAGITCDAEDPSSIAAACTRLLTDHDLRAEMGGRGRRAIENGLSWEREFPKLQAVYSELLA
jgi:glycosyltransferase involved in cell wall biosynthesis